MERSVFIHKALRHLLRLRHYIKPLYYQSNDFSSSPSRLIYTLNTVFYILWLLDLCRVTRIFHLYNPTTGILGVVQVVVPGITFLLVFDTLASAAPLFAVFETYVLVKIFGERRRVRDEEGG
jgi:hypothetical protein